VECGSLPDGSRVYIDWLFTAFGRLISAELELTSTIVYVDLEFAKKKEFVSTSQIAARMGEINNGSRA
jgi:hypothetical protein